MHNRNFDSAHFKTEVKSLCKRVLAYARLFLSWLLSALLLGAVLGVVGTAFVYAIQYVTQFRETYPIVLLTLPLGGLLIVWLYRVTGDREDKGTNMVLASVRAETDLPPQMAPLIFLSTVITHLCGGSAGREGAALQLGGSLGSVWSHILHLNTRDRRIMILCGMSAAFAAIFRTPVAAVVFVMEVSVVGEMRYAALVPCAISALTAYWLSGVLGLTDASYTVTSVPDLEPIPALQVLLLAVLCALVSTLFCAVLHGTEHILCHKIANPYLRILFASGCIWLLLLLVRNQDYVGLGTSVIQAAFAGDTVWYAFLLKMIFTALTLGGGFKGGEIVPSFFIGATFGCLYGNLIGLSPSFCAAMGMVALFCGVTNCPIASLFIGIELFGVESLPYMLLVVATVYLLSGYSGLYKEQKFSVSKFAEATVHHKTK